MSKSKTDYSAVIAFILFFVFVIGFIIYIANDWKPDQIVSEKYVGVVTSVQISPTNQYVIVSSGGETFLLAKHQPQSAFKIRIGNKIILGDAILDGGRSKLHHHWISVFKENPDADSYYLLEQ